MKMKEETKNKIIELYKNGETLDVWNNHCCYVLIKEGLYKYKRKITPITEDMIEQKDIVLKKLEENIIQREEELLNIYKYLLSKGYGR